LLIGNMKAWIISRYLSTWNFVAFFFLSFGFYYIYLWVMHNLDFAVLGDSIIEFHSSYLTYFVTFAAVGLVHSIDRLILLRRRLLKPRPMDFLRDLAANRKATVGMCLPLAKDTWLKDHPLDHHCAEKGSKHHWEDEFDECCRHEMDDKDKKEHKRLAKIEANR